MGEIPDPGSSLISPEWASFRSIAPLFASSALRAIAAFSSTTLKGAT
jgi:hypothetical protein